MLPPGTDTPGIIMVLVGVFGIGRVGWVLTRSREPWTPGDVVGAVLLVVIPVVLITIGIVKLVT